MPFLVTLSLLLLAQDEPSSSFALRDVTLIDVEAATAEAAQSPGMTVVVVGDVIQAVGPTAEVRIPAGATVVDGAGKFLIPGLFDMHVHLDGAGDQGLTLLALNGVTSVREMGGDIEALDERMARIARGELIGPDVARAGFVIENKAWLDRVLKMYAGFNPSGADFLARTRIGIETEEDARDAVLRVWESEADLLKFRNTPTVEVFRTLVAEARLAGLRVAGHEPNTMDLLQAVSFGIGSLEHMPIAAILVGTTEERWQEIFAAMIANDVHVTPTFQAMVGRQLTADELAAAVEDARQDPRWATLPTALATSGEQDIEERRSEDSNLDFKELQVQGEAVMRAMHVAGVPFLAGTDLGVPFTYPGSALHDELSNLVEQAGLSPLEALRAATSTPARWLGWEQRVGTIATGLEADLVLLEADPLTDIANVGRIHTVFLNGQALGPSLRRETLARFSR